MHVIERYRTTDAPAVHLAELRRMLDAAFGPKFSDEDWNHALGGWHLVGMDGGRLVAHAAVVSRPIEVAGQQLHTGYVEAVATAPPHQGNGYGTAVMNAVADLIRDGFEMGGLATGLYDFYARLGWERWRGATYVRLADERIRTPEDDDAIMVLRFGPSADVDLTTDISCDARTGDHW